VLEDRSNETPTHKNIFTLVKQTTLTSNSGNTDKFVLWKMNDLENDFVKIITSIGYKNKRTKNILMIHKNI